MIEVLSKLIGGVILIVVIMAASIAFDAWVISTLYGWFILTAFVSAPNLTIAQIAGVLLVFRGARGYKTAKEPPETVKKSGSEKMIGVMSGMLTVFLVSLTSLGIGWCIKALLP